ncbi:hypothetical protein LD85_0985 [Saccharolobus islandicus L.D.8.5]|uniref:Uncharacterized protein n=1 Tax=Saccharolobus islandicus (strain L.D.8.5 / Lassen \|nr:hypothetical protein LD85_0985 [Sulfolobus islandicus L.D.8.5]
MPNLLLSKRELGATEKDMEELFVYVVALIYNISIYTSVLLRVPESQLAH